MRQMLVVDRDAASRLGVSVAAVDSALYDAFGQRQVSTIYSDINQFKVVVSALPNQAASPASLEQIYVRSHVRRDGADHDGRAHGEHGRAERGRSRLAVPDDEPQLQSRARRDASARRS